MKAIKCQKGAAAVEFAIIAPLLFTIMFGIIEFGLLLYDKQVITNASREGARFGILWDPSRPTDTEIQTQVNAYTAGNLFSFGTGSPTTSITRSGGYPGSPGDSLTVTVVYNYDFMLLPNFVNSLSGVTTLNAVTVMRLE